MRTARLTTLLSPILCVFALAAPATAQTETSQTFTTSQSEFTPGVRNQGWWDPGTPNENRDENDNYVVRDDVLDQIKRHHNFFTFDLSSACRAGSATLQLTRFEQVGVVELSLWDVSTPAAILNFNEGSGRSTIFEDLGSGTSFGSFVVDLGAPTDMLSFPLNAAGVAAFNAARGGFFSIGGSAVTQTDGYLFGSSEHAGTQQLVVTCLPQLPTSKEQCKEGGWRDFAAFKNQGQCVAFVERRPR